jgi:hypothetical protein
MVSRLSYLAAWALALLPLNVAALPPPAGQQGHPGGPPGDSGAFNLQPFQFNISDRLPRMYELLRETKLPDEPQYPGVGATKGIDLDVLKSLRDQWLNEYNWEQEQEYLNRYGTDPQPLRSRARAADVRLVLTTGQLQSLYRNNRQPGHPLPSPSVQGSERHPDSSESWLAWVIHGIPARH